MIKKLTFAAVLSLLLSCSVQAGQTELINAYTGLTNHINGLAPLTAAQLTTRGTIVRNNKNFAGDSANSITASLDLVTLYQNQAAPIFTDEFPRTPDSNLFRSLRLAMVEVHQAIIDDVYNATNLANHRVLLDGFKFESADKFPGQITGPSNTTAIYSVQINASQPKAYGYAVDYSTEHARRPTGAYLTPGRIATVTVPANLVGKGYRIRVGAHVHDLQNRPNNLKRFDRVTRTYPINNVATEIASPLGGGIYIEVPYEVEEGLATIQFQNTVRAPFFSNTVARQTSLAEWQNTERSHPGPWTDFETDKFMLTIPTAWIYNYSDPVTLMNNWDLAMDACSDLQGLPRVRPKTVLYCIIDVTLKANAFSPGYPQSNDNFDPTPSTAYNGNQNHDYLNGPQVTDEVDFHEFGHASSINKFNGETESIVNLFAVPVLNQPPFTPSAPVQRRLQGPPAKSKFLAVTPPPNVVLIFADDLGYGDLGCYGATKLKTPNIDKLAAEGRRFIDAHSSSAVCTPSRYGLLTGEYPFRGNNGKGIWGPAPVTSPLLIPTDTLTIADIFKKSGYDTAAFGKWHLGFGEGANKWKEPLRPGPQDLGFDYYFGMPVVNSAPPYVYVENDRIVGGDPNDPIVHLGRNKKDTTPITPIKPEEAQRSPNQFGGAVKAHKLFNDYEVGTKLTEKATAWIKDRKKKPFFCYLSTTNVHHPFTPAKRFQGTSESGVYGDFVHELDWIVGEVRKSLEDAGVADNTLIIFTSDNGGMFNLGGRAAAAKGHKINGDLLGSKFGIWEGGHRVPFIAWWPGKIEAGSISNQLTISVDLLATFATLTGHQLENQKDSINMLPALTGNPEKPLRTEMFITPNKPSHMAYRKGKWMYIPAKSDGGFRGSKPGQHAWGGAAVTKLVNTPNSDIVDGKLKKDAPPAQLYDLEADVNQTKNLYHKHPEIVEELSTMLKQAAPQSPHSKVRQPIKAATKYDQFKPLGNLRFTFESGKLAGWTIVKGETGRPVSDHVSLPKHKDRPFNQEGKYHLSTIDTGEGFSDNQQVIFFSPQFIIQGDRASFLASGGFDPDSLYVGLVDAETKKILLIAGGARGPQMKRTTWDVSKLKGKTVYLQIVDKNTEGWGHLTFDDFSVEGKLLND